MADKEIMRLKNRIKNLESELNATRSELHQLKHELNMLKADNLNRFTALRTDVDTLKNTLMRR